MTNSLILPVLTRQQLSQVFKDPRTLLAFEAYQRQIASALPDQIVVVDTKAQAAYDEANAANATATAALGEATIANATANTALAEADALALPEYIVRTSSPVIPNAIVLDSGLIVAVLGYVPAPVDNPAFTGQVSVDDTNFFLTLSGGSAYLNFDVNDYLSYDRTGNQLAVVIGSAGVASFSATGAVLFGTPSAATAAPGTATGQLATTAFVQTAIGAIPGGVTSFNTRTGAVTLSSGDVTGALTYTPLNKAGDTMGGQLSIIDTAFFLNLSLGNPTVNFDTNDYMQYDRSGNVFKAVIGTTSTFSASATALRADLRLEVVDASFYQTVSGGDAIINFDTSDYLSYTRGSNSLNVIIGGSGVIAVNSAGMKVTGVTETDTLRINEAPTATATASDYSVPVNINGSTMYLRLSSTP